MKEELKNIIEKSNIKLSNNWTQRKSLCIGRMLKSRLKKVILCIGGEEETQILKIRLFYPTMVLFILIWEWETILVFPMAAM
jgi:hypothetical protein